jgi:hypothetical protein
MIIAPFDKMQTRDRGGGGRERALNKVICRYADRARGRKAAADGKREREREREREGGRERERGSDEEKGGSR